MGICFVLLSCLCCCFFSKDLKVHKKLLFVSCTFNNLNFSNVQEQQQSKRKKTDVKSQDLMKY